MLTLYPAKFVFAILSHRQEQKCHVDPICTQISFYLQLQIRGFLFTVCKEGWGGGGVDHPKLEC